MTEAWTWEHLAMTRARVIAGPDTLAEGFETFRRDLLRAKGQGATVLADVADMRARIADAKSPQGAWDAKIGPGRLQDIELFAQAAVLRAGAAARDIAGQLAAGVADGWLDAGDARAVSEAAGLFWRLQAAARLLTGGAVDPDAFGEGGRRFLLRETGFDDMAALLAAMETAGAEADQVISRKLGAA